MGRRKRETITKSSNVVVEESTEPKVTRPRGIQKGQKIDREPTVYLETIFGNNEFKTKEDTMNRTLYEKGKDKESTVEGEETEAGWKFVGHYPPRESSWEWILEEMIQILKLKKAKKETIVTFQRHKEIEVEAKKKAVKMFEQAGFEIKKKIVSI